MARYRMTPEQINLAWRLKARNFSNARIAQAIGGTCTARIVQDVLYPARYTPRPLQKKKYVNPGPVGHVVYNQHHASKRYPPEEVLRELERRQVDPELLTPGQLYLGDPWPGRSALDQKLRQRNG
jgi:hypothetical protein